VKKELTLHVGVFVYDTVLLCWMVGSLVEAATKQNWPWAALFLFGSVCIAGLTALSIKTLDNVRRRHREYDRFDH
jgi:hypothetical protein